jgi:hypothetical protein
LIGKRELPLHRQLRSSNFAFFGGHETRRGTERA